MSSQKGPRHLGLCFAYDPFDEVEHALLSRKGDDPLANHFWIPEPLDLVIRTGDANLISNFLPLQSGFARLYFTGELFNDLAIEQVQRILNEFTTLSRHFGE